MVPLHPEQLQHPRRVDVNENHLPRNQSHPPRNLSKKQGNQEKQLIGKSNHGNVRKLKARLFILVRLFYAGH